MSACVARGLCFEATHTHVINAVGGDGNAKPLRKAHVHWKLNDLAPCSARLFCEYTSQFITLLLLLGIENSLR